MNKMKFAPPAYPYTADELIDSGVRLGRDSLGDHIVRAQRRCIAMLKGPFAFQHEMQIDNAGREVAFEAAAGSNR